MSNRKFDWPALEREYIQGDMGLRTLAREHGITNHSLVMAQSKRNNWVEKRAAFKNRAETKAVQILADDEGKRIAKEERVRDNAIDAIDDAITRMRADLQRTVKRMRDGVWVEEPAITVKPQDVAILIDRLNVLFNKPAQITEERKLGASFESKDPEFLRALVEATRGVRPTAVASSPFARPGRPGSE